MSRLNRPFGQIVKDALGLNERAEALSVSEMNWDTTTSPPINSDKPCITPASMPRMLNIGCGYDKRPGYLNIDMDPLCDPDFLVTPENSGELPSNYFEKVLAKDVLEHIPRLQTLPALLQWAQYLKIGGRLELQTSSVYGVIDMMRAQESFEYHYGMTVCMFGSQAHPGDFHYTGFTEQTLKVHLLAAGLMPISITQMDGWLFHVQAFKFEDWTLAPIAVDKIAALGQVALGRDLESHHYSIFQNLPYVDAARAVYGSSERLYYTAAKYDL